MIPSPVCLRIVVCARISYNLAAIIVPREDSEAKKMPIVTKKSIIALEINWLKCHEQYEKSR